MDRANHGYVKQERSLPTVMTEMASWKRRNTDWTGKGGKKLNERKTMIRELRIMENYVSTRVIQLHVKF